MSTPLVNLSHLQREKSHLHAAHEMLFERIQCELRFAAHLCDLHPEQRAGWIPLISEAKRVMETASLTTTDLSAVVAQAEAILAPLAATAKSHRIYGMGHAHIDMNWMWSWPETVSVVTDTFSTVLKLMEEFPEFHFTQSQAEIYRIVEEHAPDLLTRIAAQVRAGRWEVAASHWVEGDKNMAGGESLCRQVLYAKQYMQRLFGLSSADIPIDWAPDTFGHAATMPTYLAQAGIPYAFLHRPGAHAEKWPQAFRWLGPDNAMTLVFNGMKGGYNGLLCPRMILDRITSWNSETGLSFAPYIYGVGDHGGGPTRRDLLRFRELQSWPIFPEIKLSSARTFFDALREGQAALPEVRGELNFAFAGCYTSQSVLKKVNRIGENRLDDSERAVTCHALISGTPAPKNRLEAAWHPILFSQFHDILPGSCVHDTRTYSHGLFQQSMATVGQIETRALRALAAAIDTRQNHHAAHSSPLLSTPPSLALHSGFGGGAGSGSLNGGISQAGAAHSDHQGEEDREFVLFHLDQGERQEVIEAVIWENCRDYANQPFHRQEFVALSAGIPAVAAQVLERGTAWGHDFVRMAFPTRVPAFGYQHVTIRSTSDEQRAALAAAAAGAGAAAAPGAWQHGRDDYPARYSFHDLAQEGVENALLRVELDAQGGGIRRLLDKRSGVELISRTAPACVLEFGIERPHGMSSWAIDHAHDVQPLTCTGMRRVSTGPHVAALEVSFSIRSSEFVLTYEVRRDDPRLHLHLRGTWRECGSPQVGVPFLRLSLATTVVAGVLTCEIPFGSIERNFSAGEEVPALQWAILSGQSTASAGALGTPAGLLLLNDGKHGHAVDGSTLRLNLIRSSYEPDPLPEIGQHEVRLALLPFVGAMTPAQATAAGRHFNHPLRVVGTDCHAGRLPAMGQLISVTPAELTILALKQAEDGTGTLILRLANPSAQPVMAHIAAGSALGRRIIAAQEVDILEAPRAGCPALKPDSKHMILVSLAGHGLTTVRLTLDATSTK